MTAERSSTAPLLTPRPAARARIVNALAVVVTRDGYRDSKLKEVAAIAQVSLRTFYLEFKNKEEVLADLHQSAVNELIDVLSAAVVFDGSWKDAMRSGFKAYFEMLEACPRLTRAFLLEFPTLSDAARHSHDDSMERLANALSELVEQGRKRYPDINSRPLNAIAARAVVSAVDGLATSCAASADKWTLASLVDASTDLLWCTVVTEPARPGQGID